MWQDEQDEVACGTDAGKRSSPRHSDEIKIVERERTVEREVIRYVPSRSREGCAHRDDDGGTIASLRVDELRDMIRDTLREEHGAADRLALPLGTPQRAAPPLGWRNPFISPRPTE